MCSVWLGSETGILKGVSLSRKQAFNFCNTRHLSRDQEVRALCWADATETELLIGSVDGTVKTFSTEKGAFTETRRCGDRADGCFAGLAALDDSALVTCAECGALRVWKPESSEPVAELDAGKHVCRMRQSPVHRNKVATGGKENGLKIWDLERPEKAVFTAKNLRDDWLDLRRPHWVRDVAFIPESQRVVTCTGHHQVCSPSLGVGAGENKSRGSRCFRVQRSGLCYSPKGQKSLCRYVSTLRSSDGWNLDWLIDRKSVV